jgi:uracil phosphoribosyltransferase
MGLPNNVHILPQTANVRTFLSTLRDKNTKSQKFRVATRGLGRLIAARVLDEQPLVDGHVVHTPLETVPGTKLRGLQALVPILRAGQALVEPFDELMDNPYIWHVHVSRDEKTHKPILRSSVVPEHIDPHGLWVPHCYVLDPMLATGGSAEYTIRHLKQRGAEKITFVGVLGVPESVAFLHERHPDVAIHLAVLDRCLDENAFILPGLGDFGDRYFNSKL